MKIDVAMMNQFLKSMYGQSWAQEATLVCPEIYKEVLAVLADENEHPRSQSELLHRARARISEREK